MFYLCLTFMQKIGIVGFGWLGKAFFEGMKTHNLNFEIYSRNSKNETTINMYLLGESIPEKLKLVETIVFCIPPGFRRGDEQIQLEKHKNFFDQFPNNTYVIYTSSTSVYDEQGYVNEYSKCKGPVFELENYIRSRFQNHLILRLGGLAGADRHIVGHLRKKGEILAPNSPTNLVHQTDVVNALELGLTLKKTGVYNICCPSHPLKHEVYNHWNKRFGFPEIKLGKDEGLKKNVDPSLWIKETGFEYRFPEPMDFEFSI